MRWGVILLNETNGIANTNTAGYHETMTVFWMTIVARAVRCTGDHDLAKLANHVIAAYQDPRLPLEYYSRQLLFSPEARRTFVSPDLKEFDLFES